MKREEGKGEGLKFLNPHFFIFFSSLLLFYYLLLLLLPFPLPSCPPPYPSHGPPKITAKTTKNTPRIKTNTRRHPRRQQNPPRQNDKEKNNQSPFRRRPPTTCAKARPRGVSAHVPPRHARPRHALGAARPRVTRNRERINKRGRAGRRSPRRRPRVFVTRRPSSPSQP